MTDDVRNAGETSNLDRGRLRRTMVAPHIGANRPGMLCAGCDRPSSGPAAPSCAHRGAQHRRAGRDDVDGVLLGRTALMNRLSSVGVAAIALSLAAVVAPASAQQSPPEGATPPLRGAAASRFATAKPPAGHPVRPAYLLTTVNLRSGPGTNYSLVQVVPEASTVGVAKCSDGWCAVAWKGRRGFAPAGTLTIAEPGPDGSYPPFDEELASAYHGDPGWGPNFSFGAAFDVTFGYHSHWRRRW
jgi:hypothetical protein